MPERLGSWLEAKWRGEGLDPAEASRRRQALCLSFEPADITNKVMSFGSLWTLVREHAVLREAMLLQALIFGGFNAFWATLPTLLEGEPYHLGSGIAGAFGIIGAVGALAAALAGRLSDKLGPRRVAALSALTVVLSYGILFLGQWWLIALIIGVATMDAGAQGSLVSNQTRSFALNPRAQNRINTLYTSAMFLGGAGGSATSAIVWVWAGWTGVMGLCAGLSALAGAVLLRQGPR